MTDPKSTDILRALRAHVDVRAHSMRRFKDGRTHHVYEIMTDDDPVVVRMAVPGRRNGIPGGVYWHDRLRKVGTPLPELYGFGLEGPFPYMVLERLPGTDLKYQYPSLGETERMRFARDIAGTQDLVGGLPPADHYGWLESYNAPAQPAESWPSALKILLARARPYLDETSSLDAGILDGLHRAAGRHNDYLESVPPVPFLSNTTMKNVLVHESRLSGVVGVDAVCFGDRLYVLALTRMELLDMGSDTDYIEFWAESWSLNKSQRPILDLYTAIHGLFIMIEAGRNRPAAGAADQGRSRIERLAGVVAGMIPGK